MQRTFQWGIIGPGRIARKFASDLRLLPNARLHAVASTDAARARSFADEFGADFAYGRYEDLVGCPGLDAVYVATPHTLHHDCALLCIENGIPVLCEKPFAMNAAQARRMIDAARHNRVFLMEALWTLFIPGVVKALELVRQNAVGPLHTIKADFGFKTVYDPNSRLFDPRLGGGSLLDIGIYPALLALDLFGQPAPNDVQAIATFTPGGVDESCAFSFRYPGNRLALCHSTVAANTPIEAWLYGSEGAVYLAPRWHHTQQVRLYDYDNRDTPKEIFDCAYAGFGYQFEADHVQDCLDAGLTESPRVPLDFSLGLMQTLDRIRELIGLVYPADGK